MSRLHDFLEEKTVKLASYPYLAQSTQACTKIKEKEEEKEIKREKRKNERRERENVDLIPKKTKL